MLNRMSNLRPAKITATLETLAYLVQQTTVETGRDRLQKLAYLLKQMGLPSTRAIPFENEGSPVSLDLDGTLKLALNANILEERQVEVVSDLQVSVSLQIFPSTETSNYAARIDTSERLLVDRVLTATDEFSLVVLKLATCADYLQRSENLTTWDAMTRALVAQVHTKGRRDAVTSRDPALHLLKEFLPFEEQAVFVDRIRTSATSMQNQSLAVQVLETASGLGQSVHRVTSNSHDAIYLYLFGGMLASDGGWTRHVVVCVEDGEIVFSFNHRGAPSKVEEVTPSCETLRKTLQQAQVFLQ